MADQNSQGDADEHLDVEMAIPGRADDGGWFFRVQRCEGTALQFRVQSRSADSHIRELWEHSTSNIQHPTSNIQHPTSNIQHRTPRRSVPTLDGTTEVSNRRARY